ncbi:MAG: hypothetical protein U0Q18_12800 [Bryobacteraceae bacterium]
MTRTAAVLFLAAAALAQEPVAPTPEPTGPVRGENTGDYNVVDSFETGYRFATLGGAVDNYRANVNYGNGIRLLNSFFSINSRDGHGKLFDQITLITEGLGNDPYESANLRVQKNGLYNYDLNWRLNDYFNPGLVTGGASGANLLDTRYTLQNHNLTLFPQSNIKFFMGYTRSFQEGSALLGVQSPAISGGTVPLAGNIRREQNEYRVGNEFTVFGIRLNWFRGWQDFKEDSPLMLSPGIGGVPGTYFNRFQPYHGTSPYWQVALFSQKKLYEVNGRFTYTSGRRSFVVDDLAYGLGRFGIASVETLNQGTANRPAATGNLNFSIFPSSQFTIVNSTSVYNIRTMGDSSFLQIGSALSTPSFVNYQYLGLRLVSNETNVSYQINRWLGVYSGYQFTDRNITSILAVSGPAYSQQNQLNAGEAGIRIRAANGLTLNLEGEADRANHPFTPQSGGNEHTLGGQLQYRRKNLSVRVASRTDYNFNSTSLTSYAMRSRIYSAGGSWMPSSRISLDLSYSKLHLDSVGGIAYFAGTFNTLLQQSLYLSNLHTAALQARFGVTKRVDLFIGYNRVQDTGDGRATPVDNSVYATLPAIQAAETFPLTYQAPFARVSLKMNSKLRWNAGYEYYGYQDRFYNFNNYRANTGYSSLSFSF